MMRIDLRASDRGILDSNFQYEYCADKTRMGITTSYGSLVLYSIGVAKRAMETKKRGRAPHYGGLAAVRCPL